MTLADERENPLEQPRLYSPLLHRRRYAIARRHARGAVLDLACGLGYGASLLNGDGRLTYTGADVDAESVRSAAREFGRFGRFLALDGNRPLPFDDETFDTVCSLETIEHLEREAQAAFFAELVRVLRPGGRLVISTPNRDWPTKALWRRRGWTNPFHKHEFSRGEFRAFVAAAAGDRLRVAREYPLGFALQITALPRLLADAVRRRPACSAGGRPRTEAPSRRRRAATWLAGMVNGLDLALGRLTPDACNSLCVVLEKLR